MTDDERAGETNGNANRANAAQAARAAAAAAAVGAAVGAVRAFAARADMPDERVGRDEQEEKEQHDEPDSRAAGDEGGQAAERDPGSSEREPDDGSQRPVDDVQAEARRHDASDDVQQMPREGAATPTVRSIVDRAREQLRELQGREPDSVTALERIGDGWRVTCEVVEVERIPDSTDVLATYVIELDGGGDLMHFERLRRYYRAQADLGGDE
jgi:hypothetical protein